MKQKNHNNDDDDDDEHGTIEEQQNENHVMNHVVKPPRYFLFTKEGPRAPRTKQQCCDLRENLPQPPPRRAQPLLWSQASRGKRGK